MARRRRKNPLLGRIVGITIVIHLIALPIAAHFGAFEKLKKQFGESRVVLVPLPKQAKDKEQAKEKKAKPKATKTAAKSVARKGGPVKADPNRQKVVAVNNPADNGTGDGPSITQGTQTDAGAIPPVKTETAGTKTGTGTGTETTAPAKGPAEAPPATLPPVVVPPKPVEPVKPKHVPVYAEPEQDYSPQPTIPDDLRGEAFDKNFVALFTIGPDGKPIDVKMTQSTGNSELDEIALKTAKQWKFKPATLDGTGVGSKVKLTIEFKVE
jgi:protein TonB